jgi:hypothetical protein
MAHEEYLRRNLLVCKAIGIRANAEAALKRLNATKRPAKWLVKYFEGIRDRAEPLAPDLVAWRTQAPDMPIYDTEQPYAKRPQSRSEKP